MEEWYKIENNPVILTELIKNMGVEGIQFEEILSYDSLENTNIPIYGLIFVGKYIKNASYIPNILTHWDKDLFFSRQITENASLTQSIIGVLINNEDKINIGQNMKELKIKVKEQDPITKGLTIINTEILKKENNKYKNNNINDNDDIYHIVSFVHFKNSIYELDGLQEGPILIKENVEFKDWITKVKPILIQRINLYSNNEIKFNLMALIPDKLNHLKKEKDSLISQKNYIEKIIEGNNEIKNEKEFEELNKMNKEQLEEKKKKIEIEINEYNNGINIEKMKINKYKEENERKQHNYTPLIFELLKIMGEQGILQEKYNEIIEEQK